jgi:hypothetical protein
MSALNKLLIAASLGLALSACKKEEPVEVVPETIATEPALATVEPVPAPVAASVIIAAVNLGTTVGADQKVAAAATSFSNDEVIYAAVDTQNAGKELDLAVKWTLNGSTVHEESTKISPEGDLTTNFKFGNSGTRQAGKYKAEISLNGALAQSVDFEIK